MRHYKRLKKLGLKKSHRDSLIRNLIASLILHEQLRTTEARAKSLAQNFARLMSLIQKKEAREAIRAAHRYCRIQAASEKLINELKPKYAKRQSGFTRITQVGLRKGDAAKLVQIELI